MSKPKRPEKICQGQIYDIYLPEAEGSEQEGYRPVVVTSSNRRNLNSPTVMVAVVTSRIKMRDQSEHVVLPALKWLPKQSMVCCEQRFTVDKTRLRDYRGKLPWETWQDVHRAIRLSEQTSQKAYEKEEWPVSGDD